jgi:hypothetical protein
MIPPPETHPLVNVIFTRPTYQQFSTLLVAAILTTGWRTAANLLRTLQHLAPGHPTDYGVRRVGEPAPPVGGTAAGLLFRGSSCDPEVEPAGRRVCT